MKRRAGKGKKKKKKKDKPERREERRKKGKTREEKRIPPIKISIRVRLAERWMATEMVTIRKKPPSSRQ